MESKTYIAEKEVLATSVIEGSTTPAGLEIVRVKFEDGSEEVMPKKRYEFTSTPVASDASGVQKKINAHVGANVYGMLHEFGLNFGEVEGVLDAATNLANDGFHRAQDFLFGFTQGKIPMIAINNILIAHAEKPNKSESSSSGDGVDQ